jgi:hypothetical protein
MAMRVSECDAEAADDEGTIELPIVMATPTSSCRVQNAKHHAVAATAATEAERCPRNAADCWRAVYAILPTAGDTTPLAHSARRAAADTVATNAGGIFGDYADAALDLRRAVVLMLGCLSAQAKLALDSNA